MKKKYKKKYKKKKPVALSKLTNSSLMGEYVTSTQRDHFHTALHNLSGSTFPDAQLKLCAQSQLLHPDSTLDPIQLFHIACACIPTAFVLSQYRGAAERIARWSHDTSLREKIFSGHHFATLGISQLSTSTQHTSPPLCATKTKNGWKLKGFAPWVTGAHHAEYFILGAIHKTQKILFCVHRKNVRISACPPLVSLNESDTTQVHIDTIVPASNLLHIFGDEPATQTGSLRSIAIALGVVQQSIDIIEQEAIHRPLLYQSQTSLSEQLQTCLQSMQSPNINRISLRTSTNQLALTSAQQALVATKGKGFLSGEKAGILCTQALFFMVWSCPTAVQYNHLGIEA